MQLYKTIREHINCFDLAQEYALDLIKDGDNYRTSSFIHEGTNKASTIISREWWYSFSDGIGGDVTDMLAYLKYDGNKILAFHEMLSRFHINSDKFSADEYRRWYDGIQSWHDSLTQQDREYLHSRGITDKTISDLKIGSHVFLEKLKNGETVNVSRLIVPIFKNGIPVYYTARNRSNYDVSKYKKPFMNDEKYYFREKNLYGLDTLSKNSDNLFIVEGVFDFLTFYQHNYSVLSNAGRPDNSQIKYIGQVAKKFQKTYVCFDNDDEGIKFSIAVSKELFNRNIDFDIILIPKSYNGHDLKDVSDCYCNGILPTTMISEFSKNGVEWYLKNTFKNVDELFDYIASAHTPYMSRQKKQTILELFKLDRDEMKELKKYLYRGKTQDEYATEFINRCGYDIRYASSLGFYKYTGTHWKKLDMLDLGYDLMQMFSLSDSVQKAIISKLAYLVPHDKLPNQVNCLNLRNGTLYFTEDMRENFYHFSKSRNKEDFCDYVLDYDYNPHAISQDWFDFLDSITSGDKKLINRFGEYFGSVFMNESINDKAYLFYGDGGNGKSILMKVLSAMLGGGKLCSNVEFSMLSQRFSPIRLFGKYVNFCHEASSDIKESEEIFKCITSNDEIYADIKGKEGISFIPRCKIFIDCNELPRSKHQNGGWNRRFAGTIHKLKNRFTDNENEIDNTTVFPAIIGLNELLTCDECLSAVLNWSIEGYARLIQNGYRFSDINDDIKLEYEFKSKGNNVMDFFVDFDWKVNGLTLDTIRVTEIFDAYLRWCEEVNISPQYRYSRKLFKKKIEEVIKNWSVMPFKDEWELRAGVTDGYQTYRKIHLKTKKSLKVK